MALTWTTGYPKIVEAGDTTATVRVNTATQAIDSTCYFVIVPHNATAPSFTQVKAGQNSDGTAVVADFRGNVVVDATSVNHDMTAATLIKLTSYDVYFDASNSSDGTLGPTKVVFKSGGASITSTPAASVAMNSLFTYAPTADGTISGWGLTGNPYNMHFSSTTGAISWAPINTQETSGTLILRATPTYGLPNDQTLTVTVTADNSIPSLSAMTNRNNNWRLASNNLPIGLTQTIGL